jgi:muramidase (phage lysozyme)|tara:strand:- start:419 stop:2896 length:2478 start_codon:yes stop_codon:yes gene_type:complete
MTTSFQSFNQGGQFQAAQIDLGSRELQQLNEQRTRELERQSEEILRRDKQAALEISQGAEGLAQFSDSLSSILIERQKKENEKQMLEGMREYWYNGASEEEQSQFREQEAALGEARAAADQAAGDYEQNGGDTFVAEGLRQLSGWKAYGYAKAMLQQAGVSYGTHYAQRGQELGLNETSDPRQRAAIEQQIREEYMDPYKELNPLLLHEHLFPSMRKFEQGEQLAYANRQAKLFQQQRKTEREQTLYATFVNADPNQIATNLMGWVDQYKGQFGGNSALAFAEATEIIRTGLDNGSINPTAFRDALDANVTLRDGSTKQLRVARANDFALLEQAAIAAQTKQLNRSIQELSNEDKIAILERVQRWKQSDRSQKSYNEIFGDLRLFDESNYGLLEGIQTNEEFDDKMTVDEIDQRLNSGIPVSQELVDRINDYETRVEYQDKVIQDDKLHPPESLLEEATTQIEAGVKDETQVFEYDSLHNIYGTQNALAYYRARYKYYRTRTDKAKLEPSQAHEEAMKETLAQIPEQFKLKQGGFFQRPEFKIQRDNAAMFADVNGKLKTGAISLDEKLPGAEDQVQQLNDSIKARTGIPIFWRELADQHGVDVYKLINTNLKGYGFEEFNPLPKTVAELDALSAEARRQLQFHKTPSRELRAATSSAEANWFLDSIASVESRSYGGYEAFNRGGTDGGHTAIGSGNSTTDLDKPITSMTIGEIKQRHAEGTLHAVGRYQFIGTTFLETANLLGFDDNQKFDEKTQDLFALTRAAVRVQAMNGGSVAGLSAEWIGLKNLPPAQLQRMVKAARGLPHYRQVHTLLPGVAAATLKPN